MLAGRVAASIDINLAFIVKILRTERDPVVQEFLKNHVDVEVLGYGRVELGLEHLTVEPLHGPGDLFPRELAVVVVRDGVWADVTKTDVEVQQNLSDALHLCGDDFLVLADHLVFVDEVLEIFDVIVCDDEYILWGVIDNVPIRLRAAIDEFIVYSPYIFRLDTASDVGIGFRLANHVLALLEQVIGEDSVCAVVGRDVDLKGSLFIHCSLPPLAG